MKVDKGTVATISIILAIGIIGGTLIIKYYEDKDSVISTTPAGNGISSTATSMNGNRLISQYNSGVMVDIAKAKLAHSVVTVADSFMDADGHSYEIYNQQDDSANSIVIHLNKEFFTLKYSVYNKAIVTGSGSEGTSIISVSTKDGEPIGNPIPSTTVPADEIYPKNIGVDVTGLDYVVIVDLKQYLQAYNFNVIAK